MSIRTLLAEKLKDLTKNIYKYIKVLLDVSGSTSEKFDYTTENENTTILEKGISVFENIVKNNYHENCTIKLITFANNAFFKGETIFDSENVLYDTRIYSGGITNTHKAIEMMLSLDNETELVYIITDGQTNSTKTQIQNLVNECKRRDIKIIIILVTNRITNFNQLEIEHVSRLGGGDLYMMINEIVNVDLEIYDILHPDNPYVLGKSIDQSTKVLSFLGIEIPKRSTALPSLILKILEILLQDTDIQDFSSKEIRDELRNLFLELGMLYGLLYDKVHDEHIILKLMFYDLQNKTGLKLLTSFEFGIYLKITNKSFLNINIDEQIIKYEEQKNNFKDANRLLISEGTALGGPSISFQNGILIYSEDSSSLKLLKRQIKNDQISYSIDEYGNIFFSLGSNKQAIRQALRFFFGDQFGFRDFKNSPNVIFGLANLIFLILLVRQDINLDNFHIKQLRKLYEDQTGQKRQNADKSYGYSFLEIWKLGERPTIHPNDTNTHASLFSDIKINGLNLPQRLWWATMMMILDNDNNNVFNAQLNFYEEFFQSENIEPTKFALLDYLRKKHSSDVTGEVKLTEIVKMKSFITLSEFEKGSVVYEILPHITDRHLSNLRNIGEDVSRLLGNSEELPDNIRESKRSEICSAKTFVSLQERNQWNECFWCKRRLTDALYKQVYVPSRSELTNDNPPRFTIKKMELDANATEYVPPINNFLSRSESSLRVVNAADDTIKIVIAADGTTGAGKTTIFNELREYFKKRGAYVLYINTDEHCIQDLVNKGTYLIGKAINKVKGIMRTIRNIRHRFIVVLIDTCGNKNDVNTFFDYSFDSSWKIIRASPNFVESRSEQYLCFSLRNTLQRDFPSIDSKYLLNPKSLGVEKCIEIHTAKSKNFLGSNFVLVTTSKNLEEILSDINDRADQYEAYLNTYYPIDLQVENIVNKAMNN